MTFRLPLSRRDFLQSASLAAAWVASGLTRASAAPAGKLPRVAAINTIYRFRSHAYHIAGRFIHGYNREGFHHQPPFQLVRMYNDQSPDDDLGRATCRRYGIELVDTVEEALGGSGKLDVDAVLLIAEHGDYPLNEYRQILYPRYKLFQRIVDVFQKSGRSVPVFNDKHLSYDYRQAAEMVGQSRSLGFGLMAGSSLPVTWRLPDLEPPLGTKFREGVVTFGFDGPTPEIYLFHALETLQCMLERRAGGERGVRSVTGLSGADVWKAADEQRWSWKLLQTALSRSTSFNAIPIRENVTKPVALLVEYLDGTRGAVVNLPEITSDFCFAGAVEGRPEPLSTCFYLPAPPGAKYFNALVRNIETFFSTGKPPYPVERTLLTSTVLDFGMRSLHAGGQPLADPGMAIRYMAPRDSGYERGRYTDAG